MVRRTSIEHPLISDIGTRAGTFKILKNTVAVPISAGFSFEFSFQLCRSPASPATRDSSAIGAPASMRFPSEISRSAGMFRCPLV
jgi:hypothetical protein